ncbi:MAG: hypothetical protein FIB04_06610 [Gammaproteobacteria bacterium]|nr:hypothetical protein [Gammaproteobacteria bacterium]
MNGSTGQATGIGARIRRALGRRIVWLTDERRDAEGEATRAAALVTVLGREHYTERRRKYPIHSRRDLDAVLRQELADAPPTLTAVGPVEDDKREVAFFEVKADALGRAGPCIWLVPESLALASALSAGQLADVEREGFRYFLAWSGASQPSGGAVTSPELFALATGLDGGDIVSISGDALRARVLAGLRHLPVNSWLRLFAPSSRPRLQIEWRPLATMAGIGLVAYLALASGYLSLSRSAREKELAGLGGEVEKLLVAQRDVDRVLAEQAGLAAVMADRRATYRIWQVVAVAWGKGAAITGVQLQDSKLTIRGNATVATDILAAVDAIKGFGNAKFSAPVRRDSQGREEFTLTLTLQPETDRG